MIDYFEIPRSGRSFSWDTEGAPRPQPLEDKGNADLRDLINQELYDRGLESSAVIALQFDDYFGAPLCRVWYRRLT